MAFLESFIFAPDSNDPSAPYRPSIFLCCILIFWTGLAAISEVILPPFAIIGTLTIYGPIIHFALRSTIRTSRGTHTSPEDVRSASRWTKVLTCIWILYLAIHYYYYSRDKSGWEFLLLFSFFPASQALPILLYLVVRYVLDARMKESGGRIELPIDEESAPIAPLPSDAQLAVSSRDTTIVDGEDRPAEAASSAVVALYHPSLYLLLVSTFLTIAVIILTIPNIYKLGPANIKLILPIILLIEAYIPTIFLQLYLMHQITRGQEQTLGDARAVAGLSFELAVIWLSSRALIVWFYPFSLFHVITGSVETLLVLYFAVRYALSVSREGKRRRALHFDADHEASITSSVHDHEATDHQDEAVHYDTTYYHPSVIVLVACIVLSVLCIYIEVPKEVTVGAPMSAIVYGPTIFIYLYFLVQAIKGTYADPSKAISATEWSIELAFVWVLSQAFYVLVWPVSQFYEAHVMNPYVRWPAAGLVVYIAARYVKDGRSRRRPEGPVALPPDDSLCHAGASNTVVPPSSSSSIPSI